ncbi:hypothetical protein BASA62_003452 [Batrachochytrium salamandrivorans]|nr:hypothetical protein BASA62_003452 [Batrachochytrium salamandrivorans]
MARHSRGRRRPPQSHSVGSSEETVAVSGSDGAMTTTTTIAHHHQHQQHLESQLQHHLINAVGCISDTYSEGNDHRLVDAGFNSSPLPMPLDINIQVGNTNVGGVNDDNVDTAAVAQAVLMSDPSFAALFALASSLLQPPQSMQGLLPQVESAILATHPPSGDMKDSNAQSTINDGVVLHDTDIYHHSYPHTPSVLDTIQDNSLSQPTEIFSTTDALALLNQTGESRNPIVSSANATHYHTPLTANLTGSLVSDSAADLSLSSTLGIVLSEATTPLSVSSDSVPQSPDHLLMSQLISEAVTSSIHSQHPFLAHDRQAYDIMEDAIRRLIGGVSSNRTQPVLRATDLLAERNSADSTISTDPTLDALGVLDFPSHSRMNESNSLDALAFSASVLSAEAFNPAAVDINLNHSDAAEMFYFIHLLASTISSIQSLVPSSEADATLVENITVDLDQSHTGVASPDYKHATEGGAPDPGTDHQPGISLQETDLLLNSDQQQQSKTRSLIDLQSHLLSDPSFMRPSIPANLLHQIHRSMSPVSMPLHEHDLLPLFDSTTTSKSQSVHDTKPILARGKRLSMLSRLVSLTRIAATPPYACTYPECRQAFYKLSYLKTHLSTHSQTQTVFQCNVDKCTKSFRWKSAFDAHVKSHGVMGVVAGGSSGSGGGSSPRGTRVSSGTLGNGFDELDPKFECGVLSRSLSQHRLKSQSMGVAYNTDLDLAGALSSNGVRADEASHLSGEPLDSFGRCGVDNGLIFSEPDLLEAIPGKYELAITCRYMGCGRRFISHTALKMHQRSHLELRPYICPVDGCAQAFGQHSALRTHSFIHSGLRPYKCTFDNCSSAFTTSSRLTVHTRIHTHENPYVCAVSDCLKQFKQASSLKRHLITHEPKNPNKKVAPPTTTKTAKRDYVCLVCQRVYTSRQALSRHRLGAHHNQSDSILREDEHGALD